MARSVKEEEHVAKRNEILDSALELIYSKGYERMTIQDILDGLRISRGALYHYFDSKQALLDALVDRMVTRAVESIPPIIQNPKLSALEKLQGYLDASAAWKTGQRKLIVSLLRLWYSDENALIRQKMTLESVKHTARLAFEPIIRQGLEEHVFTTRFPEQVARICAGVAISLMDSIAELLLSPSSSEETLQKAQVILDAYVDTIERILGSPSGSLKGFEADAFKEWFAAKYTEAASPENEGQ